MTPPKETLSELRKRSDFAGAKIALSIFSKLFPPTAEAVNSQSSPPIEIMKDLKPKYFLYARKSTEDDDHQIMSIEAQLFELHEYARRENLEILEEFQESKSAKKPGRELFNKMITMIETSKIPLGILAWHPDRL